MQIGILVLTQIPAILNRDGHNHYISPYQAMRNVAKWIRQNSNRSDPREVTKAIAGAYDFMYDCAYGNCEFGWAYHYFAYGPETV
jgi:hypothetical protein